MEDGDGLFIFALLRPHNLPQSRAYTAMTRYTSKKNKRSRPRQTVQNLGDHIYALPDVTSLRASLVPLWKRLLLGPLMALGMPIYTVTMLISPPKIKNKILSMIIPRIMATVAKTTHNQRQLLLQHVSGRVLDVGSGGGGYLPFLSGKASHVVCLEPLKECHSTIRAGATQAGFEDYQVTIVPDGIDEYASKATTDRFDWIILGNVLCEVNDLESALASVHQLLKPGGHVYFCEHIASPSGTILRRFQNMYNPLWNRISGGCNCNRDTLHALEGMQNWDIVSWELGLKVLSNRMVMGLARKVVQDQV
jgi:SAM-dependent methyltransferase